MAEGRVWGITVSREEKRVERRQCHCHEDLVVLGQGVRLTRGHSIVLMYSMESTPAEVMTRKGVTASIRTVFTQQDMA